MPLKPKTSAIVAAFREELHPRGLDGRFIDILFKTGSKWLSIVDNKTGATTYVPKKNPSLMKDYLGGRLPEARVKVGRKETQILNAENPAITDMWVRNDQVDILRALDRDGHFDGIEATAPDVAPKVDAPKVDAPKVDAPKPDLPAGVRVDGIQGVEGDNIAAGPDGNFHLPAGSKISVNERGGAIIAVPNPKGGFDVYGNAYSAKRPLLTKHNVSPRNTPEAVAKSADLGALKFEPLTDMDLDDAAPDAVDVPESGDLITSVLAGEVDASAPPRTSNGSGSGSSIPGNKYNTMGKIYDDTSLGALAQQRDRVLGGQAADKRDNPKYKAEMARLDRAIAERPPVGVDFDVWSELSPEERGRAVKSIRQGKSLPDALGRPPRANAPADRIDVTDEAEDLGDAPTPEGFPELLRADGSPMPAVLDEDNPGWATYSDDDGDYHVRRDGLGVFEHSGGTSADRFYIGDQNGDRVELGDFNTPEEAMAALDDVNPLPESNTVPATERLDMQQDLTDLSGFREELEGMGYTPDETFEVDNKIDAASTNLSDALNGGRKDEIDAAYADVDAAYAGMIALAEENGDVAFARSLDDARERLKPRLAAKPGIFDVDSTFENIDLNNTTDAEVYRQIAGLESETSALGVNLAEEIRSSVDKANAPGAAPEVQRNAFRSAASDARQLGETDLSDRLDAMADRAAGSNAPADGEAWVQDERAPGIAIENENGGGIWQENPGGPWIATQNNGEGDIQPADGSAWENPTSYDTPEEALDAIGQSDHEGALAAIRQADPSALPPADAPESVAVDLGPRDSAAAAKALRDLVRRNETNKNSFIREVRSQNNPEISAIADAIEAGTATPEQSRAAASHVQSLIGELRNDKNSFRRDIATAPGGRVSELEDLRTELLANGPLPDPNRTYSSPESASRVIDSLPGGRGRWDVVEGDNGESRIVDRNAPDPAAAQPSMEDDIGPLSMNSPEARAFWEGFSRGPRWDALPDEEKRRLANVFRAGTDSDPGGYPLSDDWKAEWGLSLDRTAKAQGGKEDYWSGFEPGNEILSSDSQARVRAEYDTGWDESGPTEALRRANVQRQIELNNAARGGGPAGGDDGRGPTEPSTPTYDSEYPGLTAAQADKIRSLTSQSATPGAKAIDDPNGNVPDSERPGNCYHFAADYVSSNPDARLVHGTIQGDGNPPLEHAWVRRADGRIFEPTTGKVMTQSEFEDFFSPVEFRDFGSSQVRDLTSESGHWGPWPIPADIPNLPPSVDPDWSIAKHIRDGKLTPEREALHREIVESFIGDAQPNPSGKPRFWFMGGGPAAGKSTMLNDPTSSIPADDENIVMINADDIKERLPEYNEMVAAGNSAAAALSHAESSMVAKLLQRELMERRLDGVLDGTGDHSLTDMMKKIKKARDQGYIVQGSYATVDIQEAVDRAQARGEKTGRYIPEDFLRSTHVAVANLVDGIAEQFDDFELWDTSGPFGDPPTLLMTFKDGVQEIVDPDGYATALERGKE